MADVNAITRVLLHDPVTDRFASALYGTDCANAQGMDNGRVASASGGGVTLVGEIYSNLTPVYDLIFGAALQPGRRRAVARMGLRPGDRVLEVGVGTGINAALYPADVDVVGIDVADGMLEVAAERIERRQLHHVRVQRMDAAHMTFADASFDVVYAPYTISAAPDPFRVAREMRRVCRGGGTIVFLNHFLSGFRPLAYFERRISDLTSGIGFRTDLDLRTLLAQARLTAASIERVNVPPIWSLVTCRRDS